MTNGLDIFGELCRFCGLQGACGKYIFSTEAVKIGLLNKIKCLFPEEVELINSDTVLPKFICNSCETTVNYFHEFRNGVKLVQQNLQQKIQSYVSSQCNENIQNQKQHICSSSKKSDLLTIRLSSGGLISCFNCNLKLNRNQIQLTSNRQSVCVCCDCGFKDDLEMFSSKDDDDLTCPKCIYVKKKKSMPEKLGIVEKKFECDVCNKSFRSKGHLNRHSLTHYGSKPFVCEDCGSRFNQKSSLKTHLLIHKSTNPFSCKWCGLQFRHKQTLANHVVSIHGVASETENVYECDKCKKKFVQKEKLKRHYRSHSGEKPFECNLCQRTFTQKINLKTHYKKHETEGQFPNLCQSNTSVNNQLAIQPVALNSLISNENSFADLTGDVLGESKNGENEYTNLSSSVLDIKRNEDNFTEMSHSVLNETEKGKLIQELLSFENMSPENDTLETFSSIVDDEYQDENITLKVSNSTNDMYFNPSNSNYIMYSNNSSLYDLDNDPQCSSLSTFSNLN